MNKGSRSILVDGRKLLKSSLLWRNSLETDEVDIIRDSLGTVVINRITEKGKERFVNEIIEMIKMIMMLIMIKQPILNETPSNQDL